MSRNPYRRILVAAVLLALIVVPMAGARPLESSSASRVHASDWLEATILRVQDLAGLRLSGHSPGQSVSKVPQTKTENTTNGGGCIDPIGKPWCGV